MIVLKIYNLTALIIIMNISVARTNYCYLCVLQYFVHSVL